MIFLLLCLAGLASGKIYDRCELARELKYVHKAPSHQLATWVCIAEHESQYNTSIVGHLSGDGSGDHGIFQISDSFWCSPPGKGYACGVTCAELEDDDISDDFICAQKIYKEHKGLSGDGFNAWAVYKPLCKGPKAERYIKDCFNEPTQPKSYTTTTTNRPSVFAHGFFDTAAGRANKGIYTSTERSSNFDAFFTPTTSLPFNPLLSSSTFYNPPVTSTVGFVSTTNRPTTRRLSFFNYPTSSTSGFVPFNPRSFVGSSDTFFTPSTNRFYTPTTTSTFYQNKLPNSIINEPVFIINGVKWY